jgi:hypothetical protein
MDTAQPTPDPLPTPSCRVCGSTAQPLYPDGKSTTQLPDGVVRDSTVCAQDLASPR